MKENLEEYLNHIKSKSFNEILFSFIDESGHKDSDPLVLIILLFFFISSNKFINITS